MLGWIFIAFFSGIVGALLGFIQLGACHRYFQTRFPKAGDESSLPCMAGGSVHGDHTYTGL